jgi:hypothetical protein
MVVAGFPQAASAAEAGQPPPRGIFLPLAPGQPVNPEDFIQYFDTFLQNKKLPPEMAGFFQGIRGLMESAARREDPQTLREKSKELLQGLRPLAEKPDLPPELAEMFKSFEGMLPKASTDQQRN